MFIKSVVDHDSSYGSKLRETYHVNRDKLFEIILTSITSLRICAGDRVDFSNGLYLSKTTIIGKCWKFKYGMPRRHYINFLALDCDSLHDMLAATHILTKDGIGHTHIQSSPGKYWIVTDLVGLFPQLLQYACGMPGCDKIFIELAAKRKFFALRSCPLPTRIPQFSGPGTLKNEKVIKWYNQFESLYADPVMKLALRNMNIEYYRMTGRLNELITNPEFEL